MIYDQLYHQVDPERTVRAGIIGTGHYATAIVTQSMSIPRLDVRVVADIDVASAHLAYERAGVNADDIAQCDNRQAALEALASGKRVILPDGMLMMDLPLDVVVEATGSAEAGARHGQAAISNGKHVAMVCKEADVTVGPILKHLADQAGVVYTAVDGDQPGLLMGLVAWARMLGLEVICGGKFRDIGLTIDGSTGAISHRRERQPLPPEAVAAFQPIQPGQAKAIVPQRLQALGQAGRIDYYDYEELTIVANATGLKPDFEGLHHPALRTIEIPEALCPISDGGILTESGAIEMVTCLRHPDEAGGGGGVFLVVSADSAYSRYILTTKGCLGNHQGSAALIYRPYHLCGVETATSILCAGLLGMPTGATTYEPRYDAIAHTRVAMGAGERLDHDNLIVSIRKAGIISQGAPLPLNMALGQTLTRDLPAGTIITREDMAPPNSNLWALRQQQDELFLIQKQHAQ